MTVQKQLIYGGTALTYSISGQGRPVMLVHGFGEDGRIWKHQVAALQNQFQIIVPDLPGSGQSPVNEPVMTMDGMARVLLELMDHEGLNRVTMLGHSMGGYVTLAFARLFPERLNGFGLIHSTAFADTPEKVEARLKSITLIEEYGPRAFLKQAIPNLFSPAFVEKHREDVDELIAAGSVFEAAALIQYYRAMINRPDSTEVLKNNLLPVLFVIGEQDRAVPPADSLKQCHLPALSYIYKLKNSAHMGMWEEAERVSGVIWDYLVSSQI